MNLIPLLALVLPCATSHSAQAPTATVRYLALQIFTPTHTAELGRNFPPLAGRLEGQVDAIVRMVGTTGGKDRRLGFIIGPLAFDNPDEEVRQMMRQGFAIAIQKGIATGFHIDDSMFWGRLRELNRPENIEWLDWNRTPNTGRRLDWSSTPTKIMPQLCFNSPAVEDAVRKRAALIGEEAVRGMRQLEEHHRPDLFIGLIAGWETQIDRDFDTGKASGFHALANKGFSAKNSPAELDSARVTIVNEFIDLWTASLAKAGVPDGKIYSHTACMARASFDAAKFGQPDRYTRSYLETVNFTPPATSFGPHRRPGFSTYPQFGLLEQIQSVRAERGNPPWASSEGTAVDPGAAEKGDGGMGMERYLGNLFNRGAVLVNVFGWGVGEPSNPFRRIVESPNAIAAYRKWLDGGDLPSDPPAQIPSTTFFEKIQRLQKELPGYMQAHADTKVEALYHELDRDLKERRFADAEGIVDEILRAIEGG